MKKYLLILVLIIVSLIFYNKEDYKITEDAIRFRVIANSNSEEDIIMKEKVVSSLSKILFKEGTKEEVNNNIINNLCSIENNISKIFETNNYDKSYNIAYGLNEFPEKEYNGIKYASGYYDSLVVEIGEAKGDNYWCFLYPSLCMIDYNEDEKIIYKSKIMEIIDNLFM